MKEVKVLLTVSSLCLLIIAICLLWLEPEAFGAFFLKVYITMFMLLSVYMAKEQASIKE